MGWFFQESDCSRAGGCARLGSALGRPSVAHARPLGDVHFSKFFLLVKGRNPVRRVFLAPSFFWFSARALGKSPCQARGFGSLEHPGWELPAPVKRGEHPCLPAHHSPKAGFTQVLEYHAWLFLAHVPLLLFWTSTLQLIP